MNEKIYNIGVEATMDVIGGKWKPIILCNLRHGSMRPSDLKRKIPKLSQKMLTQQLRELEADKIVLRTSYHQVPPKVVYSLSDYGKTLSSVLDALCDWGEMHVSTLKEQGTPVILRCEESLEEQ
ncbi:MarR family transcriptional regulator [Enterococcus villorum]|jgi:DNA-binding HxlR family transcriptional regulator|uniref:Transcriptional regulator n=2 Tax=Enterococcus villorum TaxID=112904 RepID=A0A1V8YUV6_9ENTE|nr:helix-turn-helix domain-containing protein [Enterococcus villorum]EOH87551.1 transcriptional regulator [Enterococcus villorum ATCC 700913]EOW77730.1 transcriptional regulator [Enterococcus villorum ATCC 700913]OQO70081.1 MarR family transcriptional regulator [Enterococcus villorum]OQO76278.1 MarR family transcriptional regulator [Enterococcus villorum]GEL91365.1 transcriptional regulator [Enterococcus villorum]